MFQSDVLCYGYQSLLMMIMKSKQEETFYRQKVNECNVVKCDLLSSRSENQ